MVIMQACIYLEAVDPMPIVRINLCPGIEQLHCCIVYRNLQASKSEYDQIKAFQKDEIKKKRQ